MTVKEELLGAKQLAVGTIISTISGYVLIRYWLGLPIIPTDGQLFGSNGDEYVIRSTDYGFSPIGTFLVSFLMAIGSISLAGYKIIMSLMTSGFGVLNTFTKHGGKIADTLRGGISEIVDDKYVDITRTNKKQVRVNNVTSKPDQCSSGSCCVGKNRRIILVVEPNGDVRRDVTIESMVNTPDINNMAKNAFWSGNKSLLLETFDKAHSKENGQNDV